jgi:protein phosphatase 1L
MSSCFWAKFFCRTFSTTIHFVFQVPLCADHKPDRADERQRIEKQGGQVRFSGGSWSVHLFFVIPSGLLFHFVCGMLFHNHASWRVEGILAVARAFGDRHLKASVCCQPDICGVGQ